MAPKKQQKMALGDFLQDQSLGSWADEMEGQPMPAPSSSAFGGERRGFGGASSGGGFGGERSGGFGDRGGFAERSGGFREQLPLPSRPPFTAHLGNLSFEVTEGDVQDFLSGCDTTSVRIVEDKLDHRPKGFGYVEFGTLDGLKKALALSETQFQGRNIRISVAEPQKDRPDAREFSDWTRKGPLPDLPGQGSQGMRRGSDRAGGFGGGFRDADAGGDRGDRKPAFFEGDGKTRDFGNWERKGPLTPTEPTDRQGGRASRDYGAPRERKTSPAWGEGNSEAGSRPPRREFSERPPVERVPTAADQDSQWRTKMRPDAPSPSATPDVSTPSSPAAPAAPASRPRLNLAKRTVSEAPSNPDAAGASASSDAKASPFGAARPIDTSAREKAIEEKRQLAVRQKKEADDKARDEKRARDTAAKAEKSAASADTKDASSSKDSPESNSAAATPRENGKPASDRKGSSAAAEESSPAPGRQYEILRRMADGEDAEEPIDDSPDAPANGDIIGDKETKPQETVREVPAKTEGGGEWRQKSSDAAAGGETTADQLEDDGFTVVPARQKNARRGGARALAS